jgi:cobalt/nickel transport system permease protein
VVVRPAPSKLVISRPVEQLAQRGGWLHRRAPEAKIAAVALITLAVLSETSYSNTRSASYALLALLLILAARLPAGIFLRRALLVAPVLLLAAALPWISRALGEQGVTGADPRLILAKGLLAVTLLTLLAATTRFADLLGGLERLRAPAVIRLLAGLMYRYVPMLREEWERMEIARRSRTPGELRRRPIRLIGRQLANLFLRAWQRADRVQAAMESRAFSGRWPRSGSHRWTAPDFAFLAFCAVAAATIRFSGVLPHGA